MLAARRTELRVTETALPGVLLVEPDVHRDDRGFFLETWHAARYAEHGIRESFVQDNHSRSGHGILRGLHAQLDPAQGKLVRCSIGSVFDVAVDIRPGSPTFGRWVGYTLSQDDFRQLWLPAGFAHGFCVTSDVAEVQYKCTTPYTPSSEITIAWNDETIGVEWPVAAPTLSARDAAAPRLAEMPPESLPPYPGD